MHKTFQQPALCTRRQVQSRIPVSSTTLWRWVLHGKFPKPLKIGGQNFWKSGDIDRFIAGEWPGCEG